VTTTKSADLASAYYDADAAFENVLCNLRDLLPITGG
jgi:hypothetical protein